MSSLTYRPEIDGLRAVAVLPVIAFHAGLSAVSGGFAGVDVFFVISGYLITSIILKELNAGTFSLRSFYERRIRRILPALIVVLMVVSVAVLFVGLPSHVLMVANASVASLFSYSNIYFWLHSGYFAPASEFVPLLHTWSLGVEEQFYLLFPVLLLLLYRFTLPVKYIILILFAFSFALSLYLSPKSPSFSYYMLPTRAWELLLGAMLAFKVFPVLHRKAWAEVLAVMGLAFVVFSFFYINSTMVFPGWVALLPCLGTALVIYAATEGTLVARLLATKPLVGIGLISYSLYLWHWPALVIGRMYFASQHLRLVPVLTIILIIFILSYASWRYVELLFRNRENLPRKYLTFSVMASCFIILAFSLITTLHRGFPNKLSEKDISASLEAAMDKDSLSQSCTDGFRKGGRVGECTFGDTTQPVTYAIIGDSHASAFRVVLENVDSFKNKRGTLWWYTSCAFLQDAKSVPHVQNCMAFKQAVAQAIASSPEIEYIILAGRWNFYYLGVMEEFGINHRYSYLVDDSSPMLSNKGSKDIFIKSLHKTIDFILSKNKKVILLGDVAAPGYDVPTIAALAEFNHRPLSSTISYDLVVALQEELDVLFAELAKKINVIYIPTWDILCPDDCYSILNGVPLYFDDDHLTFTAAKKIIAPIVNQRLNQALKTEWAIDSSAVKPVK